MILVEEVLGHIDDGEFEGLHRDFLDIVWFNAKKKIDRLISRDGADAGIRMADGLSSRGWHNVDVVYKDDKKVLVINIIPCKCISVSVAREPAGIVSFAYEIGNRHAPLFFGEKFGVFLLPYDETMLNALDKMNVAATVKEARLLPERRVSAYPPYFEGFLKD